MSPIALSILPFTMMTFCKKSAHHFLGSSNTNDNGTVDLPSFLQQHHQNTTSGGQKPPDVIEETPHFSNLLGTSANLATGTKRDPGGIGFIDDVGGSVDGLMSCTESLGFESSDERRVDNQIENLDVIEEMCWRREPMAGSRWRREHVKREAKQFPPPLSSFNQDGKPTFFLRPLRKDGKLELQEVKIGRPEILRASRQDGRLRLHLIMNEDEDFEKEQYKKKKTCKKFRKMFKKWRKDRLGKRKRKWKRRWKKGLKGGKFRLAQVVAGMVFSDVMSK